MRILSFWAICLFAFPFMLWAQPTNTPSGFTFLRHEPSARAMALGNAVSTMQTSDAAVLLLNPAALNKSLHRTVIMSYTHHLADLKAGFAGYVQDIAKVGTVGIGIRWMGAGDLARLDESGVENGTFGANDLAFTIGLGRAYSDKVRIGANVHGIFSSIETYQAKAIAADAGVIYHNPERQLSASASVHNVGKVFQSLGETEDHLPTDVRFTISQKLQYLPLVLSVMGYNLHEYPESDENVGQKMMRHVAIGGEFLLGESVAVRFGYNHQRNQELRYKTRLDMAGLGIGLGIQLSRFRFDYGYNNWSIAGRLHQLTVQTKI